MKVSVITPSYNQGQFIARTLQSVAHQTGAEVEHVVFDGGSTDDTVNVLKNFTPPVRWISQRDKGQTDALNQGIQATHGEIIGWLNSDDIYYPEALFHVTAFFSANPDIDVVYGMADHIDISDHAFEPYPTEPWNFDRLKETCIICQPALFFRRRVIEKHGLLDESLHYCMDYEYWLRLGKAGVCFGYLEKKLAGSRLYAENKTLGACGKVHDEINNMMKEKFGKVPDRWLINYAHAVVRQHISQQNSPRRFALAVSFYSFWASLRWNRNISPTMSKTISRWVFGA